MSFHKRNRSLNQAEKLTARKQEKELAEREEEAVDPNEGWCSWCCCCCFRGQWRKLCRVSGLVLTLGFYLALILAFVLFLNK